MYIFTFNMLLS